jgi:tetratricopeptide (TPR) repeat protein
MYTNKHKAEKKQTSVFFWNFDYLCMFIVIISVIAVYINSLKSPFIFDDIANIQDNIYIRLQNLSFASIKNMLNSLNNQRPIAIFTFGINYYLGGYEVTGYHIFNILVHILNGLLLYQIIKLILSLCINKEFLYMSEKNIKITALLSCLFWIVNPIQIFSVTYIVQRMNSMSALFSLIALLCYIKARDHINNKSSDANEIIKAHPSVKVLILFTLALVSGLIGIACKQNAIILPLLILIFELHFYSDGLISFIKKVLSTRKRIIITSIFIVTSIVIFYLIFYLNTKGSPGKFIKHLYKGRPFTLIERLNTQARLIIYYISLIFYPSPSRLALLVEVKKSSSLFQPISTIFSYITIFLILSTGVFAYIRRKRILSFAIFWFFAAHLVESTFFPLELAYIHRNYLPSFFAFLPICTFIFHKGSNKKHKIAFICLSIIIAIFGYWTYSYNVIWSNKINFWKDNLKKSSGLERVYINYGTALAEGDKTEEAIKIYKEALKINRKNYITCYNLARLYDNSDKNQLALKYYSAALRRNKRYKDAWRDQGYLLFTLGDQNNGLNCLYRAWELDKLDPNTNALLGNTLYQNGKIKGALFHLGKALNIEPYNIEANITMALIAMDAKDYKTAIMFFKKVLKIEASNSLAQMNILYLQQQIKKHSKGKK